MDASKRDAGRLDSDSGEGGHESRSDGDAEPTPKKQRASPKTCLVCEEEGITAGKDFFGAFVCNVCFAGCRSRDRHLNKTKEAKDADRQLLMADACAWASSVRPWSKKPILGNVRSAARREAKVQKQDGAVWFAFSYIKWQFVTCFCFNGNGFTTQSKSLNRNAQNKKNKAKAHV